ncbi:MAG: hypothetical protein CVU57_29425 [Deltaproteobacteria bacterium HGW-Deltaproteobacteria-15]|nr:MAG: hypothetical protein CVU57_29425 [Deltaproteobacteria bacterium HGW-Deltaproteobacteria-15]
MRILTSFALVFLLASAAAAQVTRDRLPPEIASQISDAQLELTNWMMFYYKKPVPDEFSVWLRRASDEGMLRNEKKQFPFLGFGATVFAANPDKIPLWMETIDVLPEQDRKTVLIALWLSGSEASQAALSLKPRKDLLNGPNYFNFQTGREPPHLNEINVYWGFLDIQWGRFIASGAEAPIRNIVSVLKFAEFMGAGNRFPTPKTDEQKQAVLKETLFRSALWSLRSNCIVDPKVLEICEKIYNEGKLDRLSQLAIKSIFVELIPGRYRIEENPQQRLAPDEPTHG